MKHSRLLFTWIAALGWLLSCSAMMEGVQFSIPRGMRAVSILVNNVAGISPGTRVDVLVTHNSPVSSKPQTVRVLKNVAVLYFGQRLEEQRRRVVTLVTSPEDAEKLTLASQEGHFRLVPRN